MDLGNERAGLAHRLRLIVITDAGLAAPRSVLSVVEEALQAGAGAIQLRDKTASARNLLTQAESLRRLTRRFDALLFLNDRFDVALAADADGVHLGPDDLPVSAVRAAAPPGFLIGYSTDEPEAARAAVDKGADYLGCGAVFPTSTKVDAGEVIGISGLARVVRSVSVPVVAIGGIRVNQARSLLDAGAAGVAVIGAVMSAPDPTEAVAAMLTAFR